MARGNMPCDTIFGAELFDIPLADNAVDVVYTSYSIEPNGGREEEAVRELYRITSKYLMLVEPDMNLATERARERMRYHGHIRSPYDIVKKLGYSVVECLPIKNA